MKKSIPDTIEEILLALAELQQRAEQEKVDEYLQHDIDASRNHLELAIARIQGY